MARDQVAIEGRDEALERLRTALHPGARRGRLVVVRGPAGIGRSALLEVAARRWWQRGVRATLVRAVREQHGARALAAALRQDLDRFGDTGLIDAISSLTRVSVASGAADSRLPAAVAEINRVFAGVGGAEPSAVLVDDVLEIADPVPLLLAAHRPGCLVVAAVRTGFESTTKEAELVQMADEVIDLPPLCEQDVESVLGGGVDLSVHRALRVALGPLYGNPGTVLAAVRELTERGMLVPERGRVALADPAAPITLPVGHDLLRRAHRIDPAATRVLAAVSFGTFDLDDLPTVASALGVDLARCERIVDELVEEELLIAAEWELLRCACPALAATVEREEADVARLLADAPGRGAEWPRATSVRFAVPSPQPSANGPRAWASADVRLVGLISSGLTNRRIGAELGLSEKTVESQLTRLFARTGCRSRVELVAVANREGRLRAARARSVA
ncbi:helix-turn-helix transcriptional regulator [Saccharopolyspora sp. MS10]|uniref:helix-turn-helix transcriptional regulator n=1 Tax=Saccharopolyspora sp. MS10 TaxID=3385973 RepID=UPI0039A27520